MAHRRIGIFGGSFNPVHNGHIALSEYIASSGLVDEVWLTLSPENPLKTSVKASGHDRLQMLQAAVGSSSTIKVCDVELHLPKPSYTIRTLDFLADKHPDSKFTLITGADNLAIFDKWRDHRRIINDYGLIVYPRPGYNPDGSHYDNIIILHGAPLLDISSTDIRNKIASGGDVCKTIPPEVYKYITTHHLYQ